MATPAPLCFVLMPFGKKTDSTGLTVDFDAVYASVIKAAIVETTLRNLHLIAEARQARGESMPDWFTTVLAELRQRAG